MASTRSKSVWRAAAGEFADSHADVDYFPAYEVVTHPAARQSFFRPNLREVTQAGVDTVMGAFLAAYEITTPEKPDTRPKQLREGQEVAEDVICEEILLEAFRK